jgi:hypothetical protein
MEFIEKEFDDKLKDVAEKETRYKELDDRIEEIIKSKNNIVRLNVGGKIFKTRVSTLLASKDTIFYYLVSKELEENSELNDKEFFFDRSYKFFPIILDYLRTKNCSYKNYNKFEIEDLFEESQFYGITEMISTLEEMKKEIEIVSMDAAPRYSNAGTHNFEDLKDRSLTKGVCVQSPYHIIFELNYEHEIGGIEIGGWNGNSSLWYVANGTNTVISTSTDKIIWNRVGTIPSNFGAQIIEVSLTPSFSKYVKFQHSSYLGIGYLKFLKSLSK